ncbi:MAG: hypothetical protein GPJ51_13685 [Candidatus Heimdallarchaeota archaeon]|nr:hypothetical protein [Candidatus Heimdallarchaeota archaeon]
MQPEKRFYISILLATLVSGTFLLVSFSTRANSIPSESFTSSNLPQDISFDFNSSYNEEVYTLHLLDLELGSLNKIMLSFWVDGTSTSEGLQVSFLINTSRVVFTIDQIFQEGAVHNLTKNFYYTTPYSGSLDISIICAGQSSDSSAGTLNILTSTKIEPVAIPEITESSSPLPFSQDWLILKGSMNSWVSRELSTAFYFYNTTSFFNLTLSFTTSYFQSFERLVSVNVNGKTVAEESIHVDSTNTLTTYFTPNIGLNFLTLNFSVNVCTTSIIITDIATIGSSSIFLPEVGCLDSFQWNGDTFNHSFDLSELKPDRYHAKQVLHITLDYSCTGSLISPALYYQFSSGSEVIGKGEISYFNQMVENDTIELHTYTTEYHQDLLFTIQGSALGLGQFNIFRTSTIETAPVDTLGEDQLTRVLENEQIINAESSYTALWFYDVFETVDSSTFLELALNFDIFSTYEYPFDHLAIIVKIDDNEALSGSINYDGFTNISKTLTVQAGYHVIVVSLQIFGINNPFVIRQLQYQLSIAEMPVSENSSSSSPLSVPLSISWLLGVYSILFFYFADKRIYRKGMKKTQSRDSGSVQEEKQKEWVRLILALFTFLSTYVGLYFLFRLFDVFHWLFLALSVFISFSFSFFVLLLDFNLNFFKNLRTRVKEFFSDVDTFRKLLRKTVTTLKQQTTIQVLKGMIIVFILILLMVNIGILFFVNNQLQALPSTSSLFIFNNIWQAYFLLYGSIIVSTLFLLYVAQFIFKMTFVEDNLKRVKVLGKVAQILVTGSLVCVAVIIFNHKVNLTIIWTSISPVFMVGIAKTSNRLAKTLEKDYDQTSSGFMEQGKFITNKKEVRRAIKEGVETRKEWYKEKKEINKNKLRGIIIWDIKAGVPVALARLAELAKLEVKETERLLEEILNGTPSLGEYHKKEQVFIKKSTDNTSGTETMIEENSHEIQEESIAKNENSEELVLDRFAIERDSEVNWLGRVRNRPTREEGWITIPAEMREEAEIGLDYDVFMFTEENDEVAFTADLRKSSGGSWFIYIPVEICSEYNLYEKEVSVFIKKHQPGIGFPRKKQNEIKAMKKPEWEGARKVVEWEGRILKGGSNGTGWITVPIELRETLETGLFYDLTLIDSNLETQVLTAKLNRKNKGWGFYISKDLCEEYSLLGKTVTCYIYQMDHYPIKINSDKIVGLPNSIVEENDIQENDMFEVEILTEEGIFREVVIITVIDRSNRSDKNEYRFTLRLSDVPRSTEARAKFVRRIEKLPPKLKEKENYENFYLPKLFPDGIIGKVHENEMIIFLGNHVPVFTPIRINLLEFIHYFGCYYADGTKKGWTWRINASTPEQAIYYLANYNTLVFGNYLKFRLIYTKKPSDKRKENNIKEALIKYWRKETGIEIQKERVKIRTAKSDGIRKWNVCGSLSIRDDRSLLMKLHTRILKEMMEYLNLCDDKNHMWNFLFGVLEGDGSVCGGIARFGISFSFHKNDKMIRALLDKLQVKYSIDKSRIINETGSCMNASIWLFESLQNLQLFAHNLFIYYPKRRKTFVDRLLNQKTVKFVMGKHDHLAPVSEIFFSETDINLEDLELILNSLEDESKSIFIEKQI